jgi:hypothetical protein
LTFKRSSSFCYLRARRTIHGHRADYPQGTVQPVVLRVRRMFLSVFVLIHFPNCFGRERFHGPSAWTSRTVCAARVARGPYKDKARTVRLSGCSTGGSMARTVRLSGCGTGGSVAFFGPSAATSRTIRRLYADRLWLLCGPSAWSPRTVRLGLRRSPKSFAS